MTANERQILQDLVDAAEAFASSDVDMPSHEQTEKDFDIALDNAKRLLA